MNTKQTRKLFSTIIQKPPLTDQLLQRPPFKFLYDVILETINATGYLLNDFSAEELDIVKAAATRDSKTAFLQKVVDLLNFDGSLDKVKPTKIVAGKEPELTNLMLQKLASEALAFSLTKKKEKKRKDSSSKSTKESKENSSKKVSTKTKDKNKEEKPKDEKSEKSEKKSLSKTHKSSKDKSSSESKIRKSKEKIHEMDEGLGTDSPHITTKRENNNDSAIPGFSNSTQYSIEPVSSRTLPDRESSGGTSKGGEDSGIADETGESERHDSGRRRGSPPRARKQDIEVLNIRTPDSNTNEISARPATAVRPQTAIGRPGTAMTRAAPPKLKRTKISDIDSTAVSVVPSIQNSALLLEEQKLGDNKSDVDQFLVEEDEDIVFVTSKGTGANVTTLNETEQHGHLVKKIIENSRELAKEGAAEEDGDHIFDMHEQRRIKLEIESVQNFLQQTTQNVQPLTRTLEFITDDFDTILKEIEESRKSIAQSEQIIQEKNGKSTNELLFALSAQLRNLDGEIRDIHLQIASSMFTIIENEKKIQGILCSNNNTNF